MTWTEQTATSATYEQRPGDTDWDAGETEWDVLGNVAVTRWDISRSPAWSDATSTDTTWTDA